jgi:ubiquinone/menaquinone biosynthesis C-methylase UbiE
MAEGIRPRRIEMWEFFNENIDAAGSRHLGRLAHLSAGNRKAAEFFIAALRRSRRILDLGCGAGLPALYVAPYVGSIVGLDAAPNMVAAAEANAHGHWLSNASFQVGGLDALPFGDREFDGASLCGALESMDWPDVLRTIAEVRRVLEPGGWLAVLEQDWHAVLTTRPRCEVCIRFENSRLWLQTTERRRDPDTEVQTRYFVRPESLSGKRLKEELGHATRRTTTTTIDEMRPGDIVDAWYYQTAQFDADTLRALLVRHGFVPLTITRQRIWTEEVLLVTASSP